ncbi:reverse transcriptase domain-containing protein [Nostoc sp. KVJ3]|uniref:reverse transcriptase domain-containing protein n=1 Tax=Nostoc sp. KVJ3 TaxID=457945 RepID=UPI0022381C17|nr:reverse transcriptase domain-containing protein [Nostoc sp. KVJ3]
MRVGAPVRVAVSPLLANLVLHVLENVGHEVRLKIRNGGRYIDTINGFRYADDVVFILKPGDDSKLLREFIDNFLETRGLKVKEAKTKVAHSTDGHNSSHRLYPALLIRTFSRSHCKPGTSVVL